MREKIAQALKNAIKQQDKRRVSTLRLVLIAIKDRDIANRAAGRDRVSDADILGILDRMLNQRKESAKRFEEDNRLELAQQERREIGIISELLPKPLGEEDMKRACAQVVQEIGADGLRDMRRCMNELQRKFPGRMDIGKASSIVKDMLQ